MPPKNEFIPSNFDLKPRDEHVSVESILAAGFYFYYTIL